MPYPIRRTLVTLAAGALGTWGLVPTALAVPCAGDPEGAVSATARFVEGAPTDRLEVRNTSQAGWRIATLVWNLQPSKGRLIFDVTAQGAGVEVFQPLRIVSIGAGAAQVAEPPVVRDGDETLIVRFSRFDPQQQFAATMDLDDRLGAREITVAGGEIDGATLTLSFLRGQASTRTLTLVFDDQAQARPCRG